MVMLIPLYTLMDFYIRFPLQCFPLICIYNFHIFKISLLSFPYIMNSKFSIVSIVFPVLLFQCPLFRLHVILFLPISFQFSSLSVSHHIFPIRGQLFHSYFFRQMSHSQFFSLLDCFFPFFSNFSVSILSFHCLRISVPSVNTRHYL